MIKKILVGLVVFMFVLLTETSGKEEDVNYEQRLHAYLFECNEASVNCTRYNPSLRPIRKSSDRVAVDAKIGIRRIYEMDERNQKVVLFAILLKRWKDEFLKWEPSQYGGLNFTYVSGDKVWTPKLQLTTSRGSAGGRSGGGKNDGKDQQLVNEKHYPVKINYDGTVEFVPSLYLSSDCLFNYERFPYDVQFCNFVFEMPYDIKQVNLTMSSFYTREYHYYDSAWIIDDFRSVTTIDETTQNPTNTLQVKFVRKIKGLVLTLPSYIVYLLTLLMFLLPQTSSQRIIVGSLCVIISTSLAYMMSINLPKHDISSWPLLGKLYLFNIVLLTVSLLFSSFIIKVAHVDHLKTVPDWLKKFTLHFLSHLFCIHAVAFNVFNAYKFNIMDSKSQVYHERLNNELIMSSLDVDENTHLEEDNADNDNEDSSNRILAEADLETGNGRIWPASSTRQRQIIFKQNATSTTSPNKTKSIVTQSGLLKKVYDHLDQIRYAVQKENYQECVNNEWLLLAALIDKIFFFIYCATVIVSTTFIFKQ